MPVEQYVNNVSTQLNGGIDNVVTTLTVDDASDFPASGNFRILVDANTVNEEIMTVTAVAGNDFTVTRDSEGTGAFAHADNATVTHVLTAGSLGAAFNRYGFVKKVSPFVLADWTEVNFASTTKTEVDGALAISAAPTGAALASMRALVRATPSPPYTLTAPCWFVGQGATLNGGGMYWREAGTGELTGIGLLENGTLEVQKWTSPTVFSANYVTVTAWWQRISKPIFLRLRDDGATRYYEVSAEGAVWDTVHSVSRTDFLTADQWGFGLNPRDSGRTRVLSVWGYSVE